MPYVCIENGNIVSVLEYCPSVPDGVSVVYVGDKANRFIQNRTHYFDPSTKTVKPYSQEELQKIKDTDAETLPVTGILAVNTDVSIKTGTLKFQYTKTQSSGCLTVINTTDVDMIVSASTTAGSFSEVCVCKGSNYEYPCEKCEQIVGILAYRTEIKKVRE